MDENIDDTMNYDSIKFKTSIKENKGRQILSYTHDEIQIQIAEEEKDEETKEYEQHIKDPATKHNRGPSLDDIKNNELLFP